MASLMKMALTWASVTSSDQSLLISGKKSLFKQSAILALCFFCWLAQPVGAAVYLTQAEFLRGAFVNPPSPQTVWLRGALRDQVKQILGHRYAALRIRYWQQEDPPGGPARTAWILEEIGKELPITAGFVVSGSTIESAQVLAFRESRGGEVRYPAFTRQFDGLSLSDQLGLSATIDGISGATLSVSAMRRMARLALYLHQHVTLDEPAAD